MSVLHHWATLKKLFEITSDAGKNPRDRLEAVDEAITAAETLYEKLRTRGVQFDPTTGPSHLQEWSQAITTLRALARL